MSYNGNECTQAKMRERKPITIIVIFVRVFPGRANIKHIQTTTTSTTMKEEEYTHLNIIFSWLLRPGAKLRSMTSRY